MLGHDRRQSFGVQESQILSTPHYLVSWDSYAWCGILARPLDFSLDHRLSVTKVYPSLLMVLHRHDETCMHGDLPLLSQTGSIAVNYFTQP